MLYIMILAIILSKSFESTEFKPKSSSNCLSDLNANNSKLLIILVDAFRWDYVSRDTSLKGFPQIAENGVRAKYVRPIFPPNSYPNWYAISTGLYGESHGIIHNYMYDKLRNDYFLMAPHPNVSHSHWWNQTEPLWINAEKQGVRTSMYCWDGCQVVINGTKASFCYKNAGYVRAKEVELSETTTRNNYKKILDDFSKDTYRLSFLYHEIVDHMGHMFGASSNEVIKAVRQIDAILYDLYNEIIERKLNKTVNVVIVSDHGMTDLYGFDRIRLEDTIDFNDIELMIGWNAITQIIPKPGKEDEIYNKLQSIRGIRAYRKNDIPNDFHYKSNKRVLPILARARWGYHIEAPKVTGKINIRPNPKGHPRLLGDHGYRRELTDMYAIMYGFGPAFKKNFTSEPIEMVDHYNLFCHILGITPHPNNGTFANIKPFLNEKLIIY